MCGRRRPPPECRGGRRLPGVDAVWVPGGPSAWARAVGGGRVRLGAGVGHVAAGASLRGRSRDVRGARARGRAAGAVGAGEVAELLGSIVADCRSWWSLLGSLGSGSELQRSWRAAMVN